MALLAMSLRRLEDAPSVTTKDVNLVRDGLEVSGVNATTHTAFVVELEAARYWPNQMFIGKSVSAMVLPISEERAVTKRDCASKKPASAIGLWTYLFPETAPISLARFAPNLSFFHLGNMVIAVHFAITRTPLAL